MIERITIDTRGVVSRLDKMPEDIKRALVKATNELGRAAEKTAKKGLKEEYNVDPQYVDQGLHRTPAQRGSSYQGRTRAERLFTVITARGKRIPLYQFGAVPQVPPAQKGRPVSTRPLTSVQILRKGPRRHVSPDRDTGNVPFVARMTSTFGRGGFLGGERRAGAPGSGHIGIFVRTNISRPNTKGDWLKKFVGAWHEQHKVIRELKSEGIAEMFFKRGGDAMRRLVKERGAAVFQKSLDFGRRKKK